MEAIAESAHGDGAEDGGDVQGGEEDGAGVWGEKGREGGGGSV